MATQTPSGRPDQTTIHVRTVDVAVADGQLGSGVGYTDDDAAALVGPINVDRVDLTIYNLDDNTATVLVGSFDASDGSVDASGWFPLVPGAALTLATTDVVKAVEQGASTSGTYVLSVVETVAFASDY